MLHYRKSWMKIFGLLLSSLFLIFFFFLSLEWQWAGDTNLLIIWNCNLTNMWTCKSSCKSLSGADFKARPWNTRRFRTARITCNAEKRRNGSSRMTSRHTADPKNLFAIQGNCWNVPVAVEVLADHHMCSFGPVGFLSSQHTSPVSSWHVFPLAGSGSSFKELSWLFFQTMEWPEVSHPEGFPPQPHFGKAPWAWIPLSKEPQWLVKVMEELT